MPPFFDSTTFLRLGQKWWNFLIGSWGIESKISWPLLKFQMRIYKCFELMPAFVCSTDRPIILSTYPMECIKKSCRYILPGYNWKWTADPIRDGLTNYPWWVLLVFTTLAATHLMRCCSFMSLFSQLVKTCFYSFSLLG